MNSGFYEVIIVLQKSIIYCILTLSILISSCSNALISAINNENIDDVKKYSHNKKLLQSVDSDSNGPLHIACQIGNIEIIKIILSSSADINLQNNFTAKYNYA
jgi:hypothetical protein